MDPDDYFNRTRLIVVAGKGGVGKTVLSASLARLAARMGRPTLLVETDGRSALAPLFGAESVAYEDAVFIEADEEGDGTAQVTARTITPDTALVEWLEEHGLGLVSKRLRKSGAIEVISTATPGIKDLLVLGKIRQLVHDDPTRLVIVDAPAAGHAVSFLRAPSLLLEMARGGPINAQATAAIELLSDPHMCEVMLVTLAEETPVNELIDTAFQLEDEVGVRLAPAVVNARYPIIPGLDADLSGVKTNLGAERIADLTAAGDFRQQRSLLQERQQARLAEALPLDQLTLPYIFDADIGPDQISHLADVLFDQMSALGHD